MNADIAFYDQIHTYTIKWNTSVWWKIVMYKKVLQKICEVKNHENVTVSDFSQKFVSVVFFQTL